MNTITELGRAKPSQESPLRKHPIEEKRRGETPLNTYGRSEGRLEGRER